MNTSQFWDKSPEELNKLGTRYLLAILAASRIQPFSCSCGPGHHCGDDVLFEDEREANRKQRELHKQLKQLLANREHVERVNRTPVRHEKKKMKYAHG